MLKQEVIDAVRTLAGRGTSKRQIAKALNITRSSVGKIMASPVGQLERQPKPSTLDDHAQKILELFRSCRGNLVRVHEELEHAEVSVAYTTLTHWCRLHEVGKKPKKVHGEYDYQPGKEMQHDTSPHDVKLGDKVHRLQCASLVLCHCRVKYAQVFWRWNRLQARIFLSEAIVALGGAAEQCMLDNCTVIMIHGTGKHAVPAPEMAAFSERFGFSFVSHEKGDTNRSAAVERPFDTIENNFYPGRTFADIDDCNEQLRQWCAKKNSTVIRHLQARPIDLYAAECNLLKPLPLHVPDVYGYEPRIVDIQGYVTLHTNKYSVPARLVDKQVDVREYKDKVVVVHEDKVVAEHALWPPGMYHRERLAAHRDPNLPSDRALRRMPVEEERRLRAADPVLATYVELMRKHWVGRGVAPLRRLERLWDEYPATAVRAAVTEAVHYGMTDLGRLERMILKRVDGEYFQLATEGDDEF